MRPTTAAPAPPAWHSSDRAASTSDRLSAFMFALEEVGHIYELGDLAARCGLKLSGTSMLGPGGVGGKVLLLEPDDGPQPEDVLGLVIIPAGKAYGHAVLFTRPRA